MRKPPTLLLAQFAPLHERTFALLARTKKMGLINRLLNTGLGNVKSAITGTLRSCDPQHAPRYLAAFEWRYNRRFDLKDNLCRLARAAATIPPQPRKAIIAIGPTPADTSG